MCTFSYGCSNARVIKLNSYPGRDFTLVPAWSPRPDIPSCSWHTSVCSIHAPHISAYVVPARVCQVYRGLDCRPCPLCRSFELSEGREQRKFSNPHTSSGAMEVQGCRTDGERWERAWAWGVRTPVRNMRNEGADGRGGSKAWVWNGPGENRKFPAGTPQSCTTTNAPAV